METIAHKSPLLVLSCSSVKREHDGPVPFVDLYDGPIWRQAKNNFDRDHIAVLSAEHGFMLPGQEIETYDRRMDEDRLLELINDPEQLDRFEQAVEDYGLVLVVGGEDYKLFALAIVALRPHLIDRVRFCLGSYLQQRKALRIVLDEMKESSDVS